MKNHTLAGNFGFVGNKMALTIGKLTKIKSHFISYKSNENNSYLNKKEQFDLVVELVNDITNSI